jgi:hypothetical protein
MQERQRETEAEAADALETGELDPDEIDPDVEPLAWDEGADDE